MDPKPDEVERNNNPLADAGAEISADIRLRVAVNSADEVAAASLETAGGIAAGTTEIALGVAEGAVELGAAAAEVALTAAKTVVIGALGALGG